MKGFDLLRQRFDALEPRERLFLTVGAIALGVILFFLVVVQPLRQYRVHAEDRVNAQRELVAWMRGAVDVLRERGPATSRPASGGSLLALADSSARAAGLAQSLQRIQQDGESAVRIRLEGANFDSMILWLDNLEKRSGITATDMTVDRAEGAGLVNATLTLARIAP